VADAIVRAKNSLRKIAYAINKLPHAEKQVIGRALRARRLVRRPAEAGLCDRLEACALLMPAADKPLHLLR
jgi:hypothetical protein